MFQSYNCTLHTGAAISVMCMAVYIFFEGEWRMKTLIRKMYPISVYSSISPLLIPENLWNLSQQADPLIQIQSNFLTINENIVADNDLWNQLLKYC